jgi:hypothetical protein
MIEIVGSSAKDVGYGSWKGRKGTLLFRDGHYRYPTPDLEATPGSSRPSSSHAFMASDLDTSLCFIPT